LRPEGIDDKEMAKAIDVTHHTLKDIYSRAVDEAT
jgi:DNA-binding XRE family transcriptional regulator